MQNITLVTAIIGAVLGIINLILTLSRARVKLKVIPKRAVIVGPNTAVSTAHPLTKDGGLFRPDTPYRLCIEVINLSAFAVTIGDVGFGRVNTKRHVMFQPEVSNGKTLPTRLEPHEAVTYYALPSVELDPEVMVKAVAYATTDSDITFYGTSPFLKEYRRKLLSRKSSSQ